MARRTLKILHISDLHERGPKESAPWRRRRVLGAEWEKNLDEMCKSGTPHLVCFTGDVAFSGKAEEYQAAGEFLRAIMERLGLPMQRLFLVPGNHDIDRTVNEEAWRFMRENAWQAEGRFSPWMAGQSAPFGFEAEFREQVLARQAAYRQWLRDDLGLAHLQGGSSSHPHLGWHYSLPLELEGKTSPIHLIGLDSAWLAGDDNDDGKLRLTDDQIMRLSCDTQGNALPGLCIALMHHPLGNLADESRSRRLLANQVDLLLSGHRHDPNAIEHKDPDRRLRILEAGCLYEHDRYPNSCHMIDIDLDNDGRPQRYQLHFRGWSDRGFWFNDDSLYKGSDRGILIWQAGPPQAEDSSPPHPKAERIFTGREAELKQLQAALLPEQGAAVPVLVCSLQGMPGVGKSYLVDRFYSTRQRHFPGGYHRLSLNPDSRVNARELLEQLAERLELPLGTEDQDQRLTAALCHGPSLLHIENVDSEALADIAVDIVRRLPGVRIAISGRLQQLGEDHWAQVPLKPFEHDEAIEQLMQEGIGDIQQQHHDLVDILGGLPLAIHIAASYLRRRHSVGAFLAKLRNRGFELPPKDPADPGLQTDRSRAVLQATFNISLELLAEQNEHYRPALACLSPLPASGFGPSLGAAACAMDENAFAELCAEAGLLSLLQNETDTAPYRWSLHPLLAEYLKTELKEANDILQNLTDWFLPRFPNNEQWPEINQEIDSLALLLQQATEEQSAAIALDSDLYPMVNGPFHSWLDFCRRQLPSTSDYTLLICLYWIQCNVAQSAGNIDLSLSSAEQMIALAQQQDDERNIAPARGKIADILQTRGDFDQALRIRKEEELPVYERLGEVREIAITKGKIADILQARGDLDQALRIREQDQLPVYERLGDVRSIAITKGKIADILQARGDFDQALRIRKEEELPVYERLGDVRIIAITQGKIADILEARGDLDQALRIRQQDQLPVYERLEDVRSIAITKGKIADILFMHGEHQQAITLREELVLPVLSALGDKRPLSVAQVNLAQMYFASGQRLDRGEELLVSALGAAVEMRLPQAQQIAGLMQQVGMDVEKVLAELLVEEE